MIDFAIPLKEAIEAAGSQTKLANKSGVSQQLISHKICTGKPISPEDAKKIQAGTGYPAWKLRPDLFDPPSGAAV